MARILVLSYRLEVSTRHVYSALAGKGHSIWFHPLMETADPSAPELHAPGFHYEHALCRRPLLTWSRTLNEQVFLTTDLSAARSLWARRRDIDLVVCHGLFMLATPALLAVAKICCIPFVAQVFCRPAHYEKLRSPVIRALRKRYLSACDAILAAGDVGVLHRYGIPPSKIYVFEPFIDFEAASTVGPVPDKSPGVLRLGFAGQLLYLKGLIELLEAYRQLRREYPRLELLLIGGSPEKTGNVSCESELRRRIAEWDLKDVRVTGWLPRRQVRDLLATLDIFVFPSWSDTYPKAVMEAMAMGIPVALSDACGCVGSLAVHEETALVFRARNVSDLKDKVRRLIESPALRARLAAAAQARIRERTPAQVCAVYERVIREVSAAQTEAAARKRP